MNVIGLIWRLALALGWTLLVVGELAASLPSCAPQQFLAVEVQKELSAPFAIKNKSVEFVYDEAPERGLRLRRSVAQEKSTSGRRTAEARFAGVGMGDGFRSLDDFTGKERDAETGLDYFGARYMSAAQGRFTNPDPIWVKADRFVDPQRPNRSVYDRNNSPRFTDPTGMDSEIGKCGIGGAPDCYRRRVLSRSFCFPRVQLSVCATSSPVQH